MHKLVIPCNDVLIIVEILVFYFSIFHAFYVIKFRYTIDCTYMDLYMSFLPIFDS